METLEESERLLEQYILLADIASDRGDMVEFQKLMAQIDKMQDEYDSKLQGYNMAEVQAEEARKRKLQEEADELLAFQYQMEYDKENSNSGINNISTNATGTPLDNNSDPIDLTTDRPSSGGSLPYSVSSSPTSYHSHSAEVVDLTDDNDPPAFMFADRHGNTTYSFSGMGKEDPYEGTFCKRPFSTADPWEDIKQWRMYQPLTDFRADRGPSKNKKSKNGLTDEMYDRGLEEAIREDEATYKKTGIKNTKNEDAFVERYGSGPAVTSRDLDPKEVEDIYKGLNADHKAMPVSEVPRELTVELMPYQRVGVEWMLGREECKDRGGLLADDMGLGKTVQSIALMLKNRQTDITKSKITLVVCPTALLKQWKEEIKEKTGGALRCIIYHGIRRKTYRADIKNGLYDVVITTYGTMAYENDKGTGILMNTDYYRVVLDEAQCIKNRLTKSANAAYKLKSIYRWALSGTPIQNNLEELFSLFHFLKLKHYGNWTWFRNKILKGNDNSVKLLQVIMKQVCLRRLKTMQYDHKPLVQLPPRTINLTQNEMVSEERDFYTALETKSKVRFNSYLKTGTLMQNYSNVLVMLLRLRQACCHPSLPTSSDKTPEATANRVLGENGESTPNDVIPPTNNNYGKGRDGEKVKETFLKEEVLDRVKAMNTEDYECPICMDLAELVSVTRCGHLFCSVCIKNHMALSNEQRDDDIAYCPTCRYELKEGDVKSFKESIGKKDLRLGPDPMIIAKKIARDTNKSIKALEEPPSRTPSGLAQYGNWTSSTKICTLMNHLLQLRKTNPGSKAVVFSQFTRFLDLIEIPLTCHGFNFVRYDGRMSLCQREESVTQFKTDAQCEVIIMSLKCASLGLNLVCAQRVFLVDIWWNPAT
eukprot:Ihof_evm11s103 gene=Ihof_evmTU11s103